MPNQERPERRKAETLRVRSITPSITANDFAASLAWYRDVVGFVVKDLWEEGGRAVGAELVAGSEMLILTQDDGLKGKNRVKGQGIRLYLSTGQDVDDVAANIKARGGSLASEPADTPWGTRAFSLVDPDGFNLTISSERGAE